MHRSLNTGISFLWLPFALQFLALSSSFAQQFSVSDPRPELRENTIHIYYDLLNSRSSDTFAVILTVTDANGDRINAHSLSGDIGEKVSGGSNKHIAWDLEQDRISMNASLFFKIQAQYQSPSVPPQTISDEREPDLNQERLRYNKLSTMGENSKGLNRAGLVMQSIPVPGLGLSRATGNPHWIRAIAGYGCLAGSVILNHHAVKTYDMISDQISYEDKNSLFDQSVMEDQLSEILCYGAIGIWIADIIWTLVGTSNLNRETISGNIERFSIKGSLDPVTLTPQLALRYTFSSKPW